MSETKLCMHTIELEKDKLYGVVHVILRRLLHSLRLHHLPSDSIEY